MKARVVQCPHLAIAHIQQPAPPQALADARDRRHIQGVIGPLAWDHVRRHRHAQRIQGRHHDLHLGQVGTMVFAVAKLEQPVFGHAPVTVGGGTIQANAGRLQVIHAQRVLIQGPLTSTPARIITQGLEHRRQPVVADVQGVYRLPGALLERVESLFGPGGHVVQPMVALGENMRQPEHAHPAQAQAHPVTMSRKMLVQQGLEPHAVELGQQHRNVIDAFTDNGSGSRPWCTSFAPETLPQLLKPLKK